jgi:hypothetical protein
MPSGSDDAPQIQIERLYQEAQQEAPPQDSISPRPLSLFGRPPLPSV